MKGILKKFAICGLALTSFAGLVACKDSGTPNPDPDPTPNPDPDPNPNPDPEPEAKNASGAQSYVAASYEERTKILGTLEKYAVENNLTGITLYEDGGYVMYNEAVKKGTNSYIPGYGFGVISEGEITADLASESNAAWKRYYHDIQSENPQTINYMNDKGSVVGGIVGYISSGYWGTRMNEFKDGYEWFPVLSNSERPIAVNADSNGLATKYKFEVKVGSELTYSTLSKNSVAAKYNNTQVKLEDYLTPYKMLYTQAYNMARGAEQLTGSGSIKGMAKYYNDSQNGYNEASWNNNVGLKTYVEDGKSYLEVEFNLPTSEFYAMYYLSSSLYAPVPEQFVKDLGNGDMAAGMKVYGNSTDSGLTPVDTYLSCGPYAIEHWDNQQIVFKRNASYTIEGENRYKIAGIHFNILPAATQDPEAVFKEFIAGKIHATSIPKTKLSEYKSDPRTTTTIGSTTTKLNLNTTTKEEWEELFGVNGTVTQTPESGYWNVEPAMSNDDFVKALSYSINRKEYAESNGVTPSIDYFGSSYLSDPENGIVYNTTDEHKQAVASLLEGTDEYGYSLEKAKAAFKKATDDLIAQGKYKEGDTITLDVVWQSQTNVTNTGNVIEKYWLDAFNASGSKLKLKVNHIVPTVWSDAYYKHMMVGQFDIGFGGIEGNTLNPLNFLEVLKSDNSSGFTLNWGTDTNVVSKELEYDNMYWSFDSLWEAADKGGYFEDGLLTPAYGAKLASNGVVVNADGTATITIALDLKSGVENLSVEFSRAVIFTYFNLGSGDPVYDELTIEGDAGSTKLLEDGKTLVITLSKSTVDKFGGSTALKEYLGIDVYFNTNILGIQSEPLVTVPFAFPTK